MKNKEKIFWMDIYHKNWLGKQEELGQKLYGNFNSYLQGLYTLQSNLKAIFYSYSEVIFISLIYYNSIIMSFHSTMIWE